MFKSFVVEYHRHRPTDTFNYDFSNLKEQSKKVLKFDYHIQILLEKKNRVSVKLDPNSKRNSTEKPQTLIIALFTSNQ